MNGLHELSNIYNLQLLCSTDAVKCHFDVKLAVLRHEKRDEISRRWQSWRIDDAMRYLGVGSQRVNFSPVVVV